MPFGVHHEWGRLRDVVIGRSSAEDIVIFLENSQRWLSPPAADFCRKHAGRRLIDVDAAQARRLESQVEALADLLAREGVVVHRPEPLHGEERAFMASGGEGSQLFARDGVIVVGNHVIDASLRLRCRQRERFGLRPIIKRMVTEHGAHWSSVPLGSPATVDGPFLEGGDVLLNGREIYVGMSGCASDMAGIDWLQALLGTDHRVVPMALRSNVLHLDNVLALIRPGLLVHCPEKLIDGLPSSLRDWDKIAISVEEAGRFAAHCLILDVDRVVVAVNNQRLIDELRRRKIDVMPLPFDAPIGAGGGLRSLYHPLVREG